MTEAAGSGGCGKARGQAGGVRARGQGTHGWVGAPHSSPHCCEASRKQACGALQAWRRRRRMPSRRRRALACQADHAELVKVQDKGLAHGPAGQHGERQDAQGHLQGRHVSVDGCVGVQACGRGRNSQQGSGAGPLAARPRKAQHAGWHSTAQHGTAQHGTGPKQHSAARRSAARLDAAAQRDADGQVHLVLHRHKDSLHNNK